MTESTASHLKAARKAKRITLRELSTATGRTASFLSEVENGIRPVPRDFDFLSKLSEILGLNAQEIISQAERDHLNPKRLRNLFFKDPELAACLLRVATEYENDADLKQYFKQLLMRDGD